MEVEISIAESVSGDVEAGTEHAQDSVSASFARLSSPLQEERYNCLRMIGVDIGEAEVGFRLLKLYFVAS